MEGVSPGRMRRFCHPCAAARPASCDEECARSAESAFGVLPLTSAAMCGASRLGPALQVLRFVCVSLAAAILVVGVDFATAGVALLRARTSVNPMRPATSSSLLPLGEDAITRTPLHPG